MASHFDRPARLPTTYPNRRSHINLESIGVRPSTRRQDGAAAPLGEVKTYKSDNAVFDIPEISEEYGTEREGSIEKKHPNTLKSHPKWERQLFRSKHESPWRTYEKGYDLKLDEFVTVATRKAPLSGKVTIRRFAGQDAARKLDMLRKVEHERFVALLEIFDYEKTNYVVFEHVMVSLTQVVSSAAYPTELQLAAILGQILEGLRYLISVGLQHGSLSCSNVLLKPDGEIKLANQENCRIAKRSDPSNIRAVGFITMELMQKYKKDDGAVGVENLNRWPANSKPVRFLSMTTSAESLEELQQHALINQPWRKADLELLEELASFTVRRPYKYHEGY